MEFQSAIANGVQIWQESALGLLVSELLDDVRSGWDFFGSSGRCTICRMDSSLFRNRSARLSCLRGTVGITLNAIWFWSFGPCPRLLDRLGIS